MIFYLVSVVLENGHVDKFILFCWLKLQTVLLTKLLLQLRKLGVNQNFLQLTHNLVESVIFFIVLAIVTNFKIFIFAKIVTHQVLAYKKKE